MFLIDNLALVELKYNLIGDSFLRSSTLTVPYIFLRSLHMDYGTVVLYVTSVYSQHGCITHNKNVIFKRK